MEYRVFGNIDLKDQTPIVRNWTVGTWTVKIWIIERMEKN
jgi:hypothetical protein